MIRALLFDLDGTLLDTSRGIFRTADRTAIAMGLEPCRDYRKYSLFVGPPLHIGFNRVYSLEGKDAERAAVIYKKFYPETGIDEYEYYDGLLEAVKELKRRGYMIAVATLKNEIAARHMISNSLFSPYVDIVHGSDEKERMEKKDIVNECLKSLSLRKEEAVLIGDSPSDAKGAGEAGVSFLAVPWGFGFPDGVSAYNHVNTPEELLDEFKGVSFMEKIETKAAPAAIGPYSQAVKAGSMLFCSGQIPLDPATGELVEGGVKEQAKQVFRNIKAILDEAGTDEKHIVKATVFLKSMDDFASVNEVYAEFFKDSDILPARSAVAVAKLPRDVMVEIEVIAAL